MRSRRKITKRCGRKMRGQMSIQDNHISVNVSVTYGYKYLSLTMGSELSTIIEAVNLSKYEGRKTTED